MIMGARLPHWRDRLQYWMSRAASLRLPVVSTTSSGRRYLQTLRWRQERAAQYAGVLGEGRLNLQLKSGVKYAIICSI